MTQRLARFQASILDEEGNIVAGATVTVRNEATGNVAPLYSDRNGLTGKVNPTTSDSEGFVFFHVVGGAYRIDAVFGGETRTWRYVGIGTASEFDERILGGGYRRITAAGDVTVDAVTDDRIYVAKTVEVATAILFPTVAARIAGGGYPIFVKNEMSNGALYPLTPTPSGSEKIEGVAAAYTMDGTRQGLWFYPNDTVTPNNWEIR